MYQYLWLLSCLISLAAYGQVNTFPANGNVGIGTTSPVTPLNIATPANGTVSTIKIGKAGDSGNINVPLGSTTGGYNLDFTTWRDYNPDYVGARIRAERINTWAANNALIQSMDLVFSTGGPTDYSPLSEQLRIRYDGNIGIGTKNPLDKLSVKGKIRAEEIKVTTEAADWPDYVFDPNYQKPSLSEIEKFIQENGHLPEVPKAEEVEANGIHLGEMNKILLKKIEELTLQAIADEKMQFKQQKLIEQQSKAILRLEKRLDQLETNKTKALLQ